MLSSLICLENAHVAFGQIPTVKRFMKRVFELRPSISTIFTFIRKSPLSDLTLKDLSYRIAKEWRGMKHNVYIFQNLQII